MAAAASSTLGAAVGVVGGTLLSEEIHAAQVEDPVLPEDPQATDDVPIVDVEAPTHSTASQPTVAATTSHVTPVNVEPIAPEPIPEPDPIPAPGPDPDPEPTPGPNVMPASTLSPDVQVLDYQTITGADGQQMDAALVNISGNQALIVDADRDGVADALVADANNNGQIDNNEVVDISMHQLSMSELQAAANHETVADPDPNVMAQNAYNSDYENNANVDDYMA